MNCNENKAQTQLWTLTLLLFGPQYTVSKKKKKRKEKKSQKYVNKAKCNDQVLFQDVEVFEYQKPKIFRKSETAFDRL
jgi:hypothetical protein